ncbi:MAG TPA: ornithine carbamoyltransferase [Bdellovibrionota bacterium]|nr:ornithine carbamoyltransferase [Bdellovibrionota bacterium]
MAKLSMKHFLTGAELGRGDLEAMIDLGEKLRLERAEKKLRKDLEGMTLVAIFEKPSLRTHLSFSLAMIELGGTVVDTFSANRKHEEPEDVIRVLGGYAHAVAVRTFDQSLLERMATKAAIPVINALSNTHHPCQVLADLLTIKQSLGKLDGVELAYVGDGNNMLHSLLLLCPFLGIKLRYACPRGYEPSAFIGKSAKQRAKEGGGSISAFADPVQAIKGAQAVYTDVWASMGFEKEEAAREKAFEGFQLNGKLYAHAAPGALVMHCMPMNRGQEITDEVADHAHSVVFRQSENRLHAQKALLLKLLKG